jgi:formate hydrogenlyase subunit 3/multisubunit Na+/H+ antiporter MnhD subunit
MQWLLVAALVVVPLAAAIASARLGRTRPDRAIRASMVAALALALTASVAAVGTRVALPANRALELSALGQFGIELLALVMLGLALALNGEPPELIARWLPVSWLSVTALELVMLVTSLPIAALCFAAAALLWVFGLPAAGRPQASGVVARYVALLSMTVPLLLAGYQLAGERTAANVGLETAVVAFLVPAFGLVLGLIPLHAWTLTLASGTPRAMLFGVLALVQTAGFVLLLRTIEAYPWLASGAREVLVFGGALSVLVGGWLAVSSRLDDPDDWLVYATVASGGMLLVGLGNQTRTAVIGVLVLLLARVFALLILSLAPRAGAERLARLAVGMGTLTLAGTPGLAGFPGLWLVLQPLQGAAAAVIQVAVLSGSGLLFATALRRWSTAAAVPGDDAVTDPGARPAIYLLIAVLVVLGLLPSLIIPALADVLREVFLLL